MDVMKIETKSFTSRDNIGFINSDLKQFYKQELANCKIQPFDFNSWPNKSLTLTYIRQDLRESKINKLLE